MPPRTPSPATSDPAPAWLGLAAGIAATALSGALYALAFPPLRWEVAAWFCLVPFFVALRRSRLRTALLLGFLWAQFASAFVADALPAAVSTYYLQPVAVGWAFAIGVWAFTGSVYYVGFALAAHGLARFGSLATRPVLLAAAWTAFELARGRLWTGSSWFVGNPWALFGYSQTGFPELMQIASLTGIYGVGFCLTCVNAALAELWLAWRDGALPRAVSPRDPLVAGCAAALWIPLVAVAFGAASLRAAPPESQPPPVRVAVVQGDVDLGSRWRSEFYGRNLDVYLDLTLQALGEGRPEIVFWPEAALTFMLEDEPLYRRALSRVLAGSGIELVAGGPRQVREEPPAFHNSTFLIGPDGEIGGRYDKQYLVPFAEFFPLRGLDLVRRRFERVQTFEHGGPTPPLPTRAGAAGVLTCNEAMLPEVAVRRAQEGATLLVNPSNDSWIQEENWADLMFDIVAVRAIEQRRYLVRASTSGPSAVVDPWGRVRARTEPFSRAILLSAVEPLSELSLYARLGDAFALGCGAAVLLAIGVGRRRARAR